MAIKINQNQLANLPAFVQRQITAATKRTLIEAAHKALVHAKRTANMIKWSGEYMRGFTLEEGKSKDQVVVKVYNDAPHAQAIEVGQGPYKVDKAEFDRIVKWAQTKLGLDYDKARGMAIGVSRRIADKGKYALGVNNGKAHYVLKIAVDTTSKSIPSRWKKNVKQSLEKVKVPG